MMKGRTHGQTIISRQLIKPSSPTPTHLHTYNLSQLDQIVEKTYMPVILFYPNNETLSLTTVTKAQMLKKALSLSLTRYYPFAGRLNTPTTTYIDCNDEGVLFIETMNDAQLGEFQNISEQDETLIQLFADGMVWHNSPHSNILVGVQVNHFSCGGLGVAISMSHIIGDGCTLGSFITHWVSVAAYGSTDHKDILPFNPHLIQYPPSSIDSVQQPDIDFVNHEYATYVTRKYVFPNSYLSDLKNEMISRAEVGSTMPIIKNPTRVEVLISLLFKNVLAATSKKSDCQSHLIIPVDIRKILAQKLPQNTVGNFMAYMMVTARNSSNFCLGGIVADIKKEKVQLELVQTIEQAGKNIKSVLSKVGTNEDEENFTHKSYWCSSLCGLPFHKLNFGWGKPIGVSIPLKSVERNGFILTDTLDGDGIQVLVSLEKDYMEIFEKHDEILPFLRS